MSGNPDDPLVPDRDNLPLKKRRSSPHHTPTFKTPYPYKSQGSLRARYVGLCRPVPKRAPALYQPWTATHGASTHRRPVLSAFREHHGWAEWREFSPLHPGWDFPRFYHHLPVATPGLHPGRGARLRAVAALSEGARRGENIRGSIEEGAGADRRHSGRNGGRYERGERNVDFLPKIKMDTPPYTANLTGKHDVRTPQSRRPLTDSHPPTSSSSSSSSSLPNHFPWLLPHFAAGSLIELRDGRLRRVEDLQTNDFLLGSLARPDLQLSCCTVQSISPPTSSGSTSRLLILLHDQQTQELVDVYIEYPFFVRGRGWSSCCPQRTATLCGLCCRQLSVGDVCLALTPVTAPWTLPSHSRSKQRLEPVRPGHVKAACSVDSAKMSNGPSAGPKKETETSRKRHSSAPELRGPGTNCP